MIRTSGISAMIVRGQQRAAHHLVGAPAAGRLICGSEACADAHDLRSPAPEAIVMPVAPVPLRAVRAAGDEPARDDVHDQREHEQHEAGREQRRGVDRPVRGLAELVRDHRGERVALANRWLPIVGALPITSTTAIVSPIARPRPSIAPPVIPGREYGRTAIRIISQRVAPSASAASLFSRRDGRDAPRARSPTRSAGS